MTFGKITWMNSMRDLRVILSLVSTVYNIVLKSCVKEVLRSLTSSWFLDLK